MTIKNLIEKAIKGEWKMKDTIIVDFRIKKDLVIFFCNGRTINDFDDVLSSLTLEQIVLDPKFWQAVGKVENWEEKICRKCGLDFHWKKLPKGVYNLCNYCRTPCGNKTHIVEWQYKMQEMINSLCKGESLENYIKTL